MRVRLDERTVDFFRSFGKSNLTDKHYKIRLTKDYTYNLVKILSVKEQGLRLYFSVRPTFSTGKKSSREGNLRPTTTYDVQIQFDKAVKYLEPFKKDDPDMLLSELYLLDLKDIRKFWRTVVDKCDVRFYSNDHSFYWQGFWEDLSNQRAAIKPFKGKHGDGTWRKRHQASGGLVKEKLRVTKHIAQILIDLEDYERYITTYLSKSQLKVTNGVGDK